ncbi:hypothetical protein TNCV_4361861 [Trichonephila clavipes]|nr:hypothetical protein TNCV_4361861 [Trichonephila clavipes]
MRIILKDDIPVYQPARRLSFSENQDVNKQIDEWLEQGIVRPSSSEYASPIVLVKKKDGTTRLCVDYRRLNRKLVKDRFPLPLIEDVLDRLQGAKVYTTRQEVSGTNNSQTSAELLGLTGYFRKFIPAYSQIAKPLSDLTRKDNPFMFEQPQMEAFEKLKKLLTESPVLSIFQQGRTTELHTDASQQGYGAVLLREAEDRKLHPVQYMSQKTTPAEENIVAMNWKFLLLSTL